MLHLKFALNLEHLADEMIETISKIWTDPFQAPAIIFPDPKLEQWFRLRYTQKVGVVANLNIITLDKFLFQTLSNGDTSKKKLSADIIRNVLIAYLKNGDLKKDGLGELETYLNQISGNTDDAKLFDFANALAGLFLEYETSRPGNFISPLQNKHHEGFLEYWKQGNLRDFFSTENKVIPKEKWQQKIYTKLFHNNGCDSLLTKAFKATAERSCQQQEYLTLPYLFSQCGNSFHLDKPIFIFGLSGMGQFYRVILQEIARQQDIYAFIQNPCMEFWEDVDAPHVRKWNKNTEPPGINLPEAGENDEETHLAENENLLLKNWGRTGRENTRLWCLASDYSFDFSGNEYQPDSLLHQVQHLVAHRKNFFDENFQADNSEQEDSSLTLTAAPSALREIEALHSEVCHLLQKGVRLDEIIVISPNLDLYRSPIEQVFNAIPKDSPFYIPYSITDYPEKDSLTESAIDNLFRIHQQQYISRPEFFSLVKNPVVQASFEINPDFIDAWEQWIVNMNIYRHVDKKYEDDWTHCIHQLLLAQVSASPLSCQNGTFWPYSDIETSNVKSVQKFIECIDELNLWIHFAKEGLDDSNKNGPDQLKAKLARWVSLPAKEDSLLSEKNVWQKIQNAIDLLNFQFDAGAPYISWSIVKQTLHCACENSRSGNIRLFNGGLTFMRFAVNRTIPTKHIFFVGANANVFPGRKKQNTMDLRTQAARWPGDDSTIDRNCYTFLCQLMSAKKGFHISFINRNLQKDEELFPSAVVKDLQFFLDHSQAPHADAFKQKNIPLDETREFKDLFTPRAIRKKNNLLRLSQEDIENVFVTSKKDDVLPKEVSCTEFKKFFVDPFRFQLERAIHLPSTEDDPEKDFFEPIELKKFDQDKLLKEYVYAILQNDFSMYNRTEQEWILKKKLPNGVFGEIILQDCNNKATDLAISIQRGATLSNATYQKRIEHSFVNGNHAWTLGTLLDWHVSISSHEHNLFTVKSSENVGMADYIKMYLDALLLAASSTTKDIVESFHLDIYTYKNEEPARKSFSISPIDAATIIREIFNKSFVDKYQKCVPVQLLDSAKITTFADYKYSLTSSHGPWEYFKGKRLFAPEKFSGFSNEDFKTDWSNAVLGQVQLLKPIWSDDNE